MDPFLDRLAIRAATVDEIFSKGFKVLPGQKVDSDMATRRLAAWCRTSASGDWALFTRRLERDGLSLEEVLSRFATIRLSPDTATPQWLDDARWIFAALQVRAPDSPAATPEPQAFEHLFAPAVAEAEQLLWSGLDRQVSERLTDTAAASLRHALISSLSELSGAALFERFTASLKVKGTTATPGGAEHYRSFLDEMRQSGLRRLFEDKPVLLRLIATVVRQWLDTTREMLVRLDADLPEICRELLHIPASTKVAAVEGGLSDPHNGGHSVQILVFEDGRRVLYKPKNLQLDVAWQALIERLNRSNPPVELKAVRVLSRRDYGWTEFVHHTACADRAGFETFFRRAGAWLALFHIFAGTDMHEENMIASSDQPVPIDLEMILQASSPERESEFPERKAFDLAARKISESVMMTGLLPAYSRSADNQVFEMGGLTGERGVARVWRWENLNMEGMRRLLTIEPRAPLKNIPHFCGKRAKLGDYTQALIEGFESYAAFLLAERDRDGVDSIFADFAGLPARKFLRPTRFYDLLLRRLKDHRTMTDGIQWSAQADFMSRLADWNGEADPLWALQRAERDALVELNVPHFVSPTDRDQIASASGHAICTGALPGIERARARFGQMAAEDIAWQSEIIRQSTRSAARSDGAHKVAPQFVPSGSDKAAAIVDTTELINEARAIFQHLSEAAIRNGPGAAWLGLHWLGDSDASQLVPLGTDLYSGASGISVFLAAYARQSGEQEAADLALAGIAALRRDLRGPTSARVARALGVGGASGLGSVVYAMSLIADFIGDGGLMGDAEAAVGLFSDDLIAADKALDIIDGSAGAIVGLLRFHRATRSGQALERAIKCGDHLLNQKRIGDAGRRNWARQGSSSISLNGMSHGAAGYAYALSALAAASGGERFAAAARECIAFENATYSAAQGNWPDMRPADGKTELRWTCQWCHGAPGIGLARIATLRQGVLASSELLADVRNALIGVEKNWPCAEDTLCCGTLGVLEFLREAGAVLNMKELTELAMRRLPPVLRAASANGDYRFGCGGRRFNLGLFRGIAGLGYGMLRAADCTLPNILVWE